MAALTSDATTEALAPRFDVHAHQIAQWKQQLVAQAAAVFSAEGVRTDVAPAVDVKALHAKIGQQALKIDFFGRRARAATRLERHAMIDRTHDLALTRQAALVGLSRASVYYTPQGCSDADLALMRRLDALHLDLPFAGSRMLRDLLRGDGIAIWRDHVRTLMRRMGINAIYRRPRTSHPHPTQPISPYLLRGLTIDRPNHVWATDITYVPMARGVVYLCAIMDWAARKVLAWRVSATRTADFCVAALEEALDRFGSPEIFSTDQRSQFTSDAFVSVLRRHDIQISMDGRGCWRDNVFVERLWRSVKYEAVSAVRTGLKRCFTFFNHRRPHTAHAGRTPEHAYTTSEPNPSAVSTRARVPKKSRLTCLNPSDDLCASRLPMRPEACVRIWLILPHERFESFGRANSSVKGNPARCGWLVSATAMTVPERALNTS